MEKLSGLRSTTKALLMCGTEPFGWDLSVIERVRHPLLEVQCSTFCTNRAHTKAPRVADGDSSKKDIFKFHCASCTLATQRVANAMSVEILAKFFISESQAAAMRSKIMTILLSFRASTINNLSDPMPTSASP